MPFQVGDLIRRTVDGKTRTALVERVQQAGWAVIKGTDVVATVEYPVVYVRHVVVANNRVLKTRSTDLFVVKGDFVGHPFRGNQWGDASGSGRALSGGDPTTDDTLSATLSQYPETTDELEQALSDSPITNSPLGNSMKEINENIYAAEQGDGEESDMLEMVVFSAYLGKSRYFYEQLNTRLRKGTPFDDELQATISDKNQERLDQIDDEINDLEEEQAEGNDTDNSSEITELEDEKTAIEDAVDEAEELDAWDWNYYDHHEMDFNSKDGSVTLDIEGNSVRMPLVVAANFMDDGFRELTMKAPANMRVYRGIDPAFIATLEGSVGETVKDLGFCSTSIYVGSAVAFSGLGTPMQSQLHGAGMPEQGSTFPADKRIATILIPKGYSIVMPDPDGERMGEGEVLLNRGTQFKVIGVNEMGPVLEVLVPDAAK